LAEFFGLCTNEAVKLWCKRRFLITIALAVCLSVLISWAMYHESNNNRQMNNPQTQIQNLQDGVQSETASLSNSHLTAASKQQIQQSIQQMKQQIAVLQAQVAHPQDGMAALTASIQNERQQLASAVTDPSTRSSLELELALNEYRQAHHLSLDQSGTQTSWGAIKNYMDGALTLLLPLLIVVLTADIVSGESSDGTIKLLLVRPQSRARILLAKYITVLWASAIVVLTALLTVGIFSALVYGFKGASDPIAVGVHFIQTKQITDGIVSYMPIPDLAHMSILPQWLFTLDAAALCWVACAVVATITFLLSVLFRSVSATMGVAIGLLIAGTIVVGISAGGGTSKWIVPLFFTHLNLVESWTGQLSRTVPTTFGLSLIVLGAWILVSIGVAWRVFTRKDILA